MGQARRVEGSKVILSLLVLCTVLVWWAWPEKRTTEGIRGKKRREAKDKSRILDTTCCKTRKEQQSCI